LVVALGWEPEEPEFLPGDELADQVEQFQDRLHPVSTLPSEFSEFAQTIKSLALPNVPEPRVLWVIDIDPMAAGVGDRVRCAAKHTRGSLGFPVNRSGSGSVDGFLTAGHVTRKGVGSSVELEVPSRLGRSTYSSLGKVVQHADPVGVGGVGGWDYAVVELNPGVPGPPQLTSKVASLPNSTPQPIPVTMYAALSGIQTGGIIGSLNTLGLPPAPPPAITRLWRDCWIMIPSAIAQRGDSGAAVLETSTGSAVGMLIGGSRQVPGTTYAVQYVQDLDNLITKELAAASVSII
jgi:hypothetical protein